MDQETFPTFATRRETVEELEAWLYKPIPVLDHGFVRVVDYMGSDAAIVQAARVSYGRGTKKSLEDRGLIFYLMRHRHSTPFEMCEIKFHIKLPIFIARQWIRHRTANVNEYSARYSVLDREFYLPSREVLAEQSQTNRQGREHVVSEADSAYILDLLRRDAMHAYDSYEHLLNDPTFEAFDETRPSLARELARMNLSLNFYTQWYWKIDLHNFMHFLSLRADSHAQYEIRAYAQVLIEILKVWVPLAYEAFCEYRLNSHSFSASAVKVIQKWIQGENVTQSESGMSAREWKELMNAFPSRES